MRDGFARTIEYLRISVTDRCSLRCRYCMPETGVPSLSHDDILTYDEIVRAAGALTSLGVRKIRLTGGEPLVRKNVSALVAMLAELPERPRLVLTTNGVALTEHARELKAAGLSGVNVSLDTLSEHVFERITRRDGRLLEKALAGIEAAQVAGLAVKLNCVPMVGVNEEESPTLVRFAAKRKIPLRFISLMPIGCAAASGLIGMSADAVRQQLTAAFGALEELPNEAEEDGEGDVPTGPARYFALPDGSRIGFIDALDHPFCTGCNRVRLTAEGFLKLCLQARDGLDVRALLRGGASNAELRAAIADAIGHKPQEHHFGHADAAADARYMYQVGG